MTYLWEVIVVSPALFPEQQQVNVSKKFKNRNSNVSKLPFRNKSIAVNFLLRLLVGLFTWLLDSLWWLTLLATLQVTTFFRNMKQKKKGPKGKHLVILFLNLSLAGLWLVDTSTTHIVIPSSQVGDLFLQLYNLKGSGET